MSDYEQSYSEVGDEEGLGSVSELFRYDDTFKDDAFAEEMVVQQSSSSPETNLSMENSGFDDEQADEELGDQIPLPSDASPLHAAVFPVLNDPHSFMDSYVVLSSIKERIVPVRSLRLNIPLGLLKPGARSLKEFGTPPAGKEDTFRAWSRLISLFSAGTFSGFKSGFHIEEDCTGEEEDNLCCLLYTSPSPRDS